MGCGCRGKRTAQTSTKVSSFELRMPGGATSSHGSRLEAEAENARRGGGGKVKPATTSITRV